MRLEEEEEEEEEEPKKKSSGSVKKELPPKKRYDEDDEEDYVRPRACVAVQDVCVWTQACISQRLESDDDVDTVAYIYV
jgi:hypothetical protein